MDLDASSSLALDQKGCFRLLPSLQHCRVTSLPPSAYYISDFITEDEEKTILDKIANAPKPRWKQLAHRRLQAWPSDLVKHVLVPSPLPQWLDGLVPRILAIPASSPADADGQSHQHLFAKSPHGRPNHVLVNEYTPGSGIMPHRDGSAYWPVVCTVSLGASLCLHLYKTRDDDGALDPEPVGRILQEPRSLLITTDKLYSDYLHGISEVEEDVGLSEQTVANWSLLRSRSAFAMGHNPRQTRTSLTFRDVIKVSTLGGLFKPR